MQIPSFTPKNLSSNTKSDSKENEEEKKHQEFDDCKLSTSFVPTSVIINTVLKNDKNMENFKYKKKKQKTFSERNGDWFCKKCNNLNFAFRKECNMCKYPKGEEEVPKKEKEEKASFVKKNDNHKKNKNYFDGNKDYDRNNFHKKGKYRYKKYGVVEYK
jgi:hypothetical protein